jgi:HD superfamily phosphohydrolase
MPQTDPLTTLRRQVANATLDLFGAYHPRLYRSDKVVRDVVWGMIDIFPHELALIDSPIFQRLRGVYQTSLALLTYPCAIHSRFEHSVGALAVADRVLRALERRADVGITDLDRLEVRLASLLHDWTHGPLSHTSEAFYKSNPIFPAIRAAHPLMLGSASASEILTYCLITSEPFGHLWEEIVAQYHATRPHGPFLSRCDRWRIATMIVGADANTEKPASSPQPENRFLRQLVNGPFDVDKLDYIARDGYFTGLNLGIDVDRLLWVMDTIQVDTDDDRRTRVLCVAASGATILEQVVFAKMQLFSSLYYHHKVRAAHQAALRLLAGLEEAGIELNGRSLSEPSTFLCLDDYDVLHGCFQQAKSKKPEPEGLQRARRLAKSIKERNLPMRALVLAHPAWGSNPCAASDAERGKWVRKMMEQGQPNRFAAEVAGAAGLSPNDVWVDIPEEVNLQGTGAEALVKFDDHTFLPIQDMFPISGWLSAYQLYRMVSYIFAVRDRERVGRAACEILARDYDITVSNVALKLARV